MKPTETIDFHIKSAWLGIANLYNQLATKHQLSQATGFVLLNISEEGTAATKIAPLMGMKSTSLSRILKKMEKMDVKKILGFTNVSIRTNNEVAFSDKALYNKNTGICKLFGNVKLQKGSSFLTGDYAEVDMNKGISKLLPAPNLDNLNENRVRALIDKTENYEINESN